MERWYAIAMIAFVVAMFGSFAAEAYMKGQCRTEAIKAGKSVEDIEKICR